ncbi:methylated-DNA--protein-cysteine methyltransferase isoform X3 [Hippopotamus amphibius kiboko]|uniref:methylated-DNA--protein-cysteine methyltransferase isoform X3 n=1 Tax=Hippopotamus amphibius kiboko TaxID=575201 RepID=UPI0025964C00|nr:methylated-DNA--protein-cysteine methyltransferase isoform X3 [Hippopotamus amphibius kiboko]
MRWERPLPPPVELLPRPDQPGPGDARWQRRVPVSLASCHSWPCCQFHCRLSHASRGGCHPRVRKLTPPPVHRSDTLKAIEVMADTLKYIQLLSHSFTRQVLWKLLKAVKFGETVSYQQLAALAGNPKAARAAGGAMRRNPVRLYPRAHTHPHPVPQSGLQQRGHGQLLRRRGREGVASGPRRQRGGEAGAWRGLPSSWKLAQGSGWHHQLPACWPGLSVCGSGTPGAGRRLALPY